MGNPSTVCWSTRLGLASPASCACAGFSVDHRRLDEPSRRSAISAAATLRSPAAEVHSAKMFDWNDLRYFLAVARHGSTIAAGKSLGLSQSTVQRRVNELEKRIGRQLMARHSAG